MGVLWDQPMVFALVGLGTRTLGSLQEIVNLPSVRTGLQKCGKVILAMEYEGGREERILAGEARIVRADRQPCPVCGHPTGDCTGQSAPPVKVVGPEIFPSLEQEEVYVVPEDVWDDVQITPFTKTRVLVAAKGAAMPMSRAKELGLC